MIFIYSQLLTILHVRLFGIKIAPAAGEKEVHISSLFVTQITKLILNLKS